MNGMNRYVCAELLLTNPALRDRDLASAFNAIYYAPKGTFAPGKWEIKSEKTVGEPPIRTIEIILGVVYVAP